jgi:hypothetical protein
MLQETWTSSWRLFRIIPHEGELQVPKLSKAITEVIYQGRNQKLSTFFLFKRFSKLVEIVRYLITTTGTASPLIKYDRKRLT